MELTAREIGGALHAWAQSVVTEMDPDMLVSVTMNQAASICLTAYNYPALSVWYDMSRNCMVDSKPWMTITEYHKVE